MQMEFPRHLLNIDCPGIAGISTGEIILVPTVGGPLVRPLDLKPPITMVILFGLNSFASTGIIIMLHIFCLVLIQCIIHSEIGTSKHNPNLDCSI